MLIAGARIYARMGDSMKIVFPSLWHIGLGYIGLPPAAVFASCSIQVNGIDVSEPVINRTKHKRIDRCPASVLFVRVTMVVGLYRKIWCITLPTV